MKKLFSILLALTMLLLTACGGTASQTPDEPLNDSVSDTALQKESIYTEASGISADKTVVSVNGNDIPAALYFYWAMSNTDNLLYQMQLYNLYYGLYAEVFQEDGTINWDAVLFDDQTLSDQVEQQTQSSVCFYATVENMAAELGITLTQEDRAAMAEQRNTVAESYREQLIETDPTAEDWTADELMSDYLMLMGIDEALYERISSVYYLFESLKALVTTEGSALYLEDADCNEYGYYADHILIPTIDLTTRESLSEEEIAEKRALAESLLTRLEDNGNSVELFTRLADEYSEDTGRATNPTGYIFTPGTMVSEFEDATEALAYGEISGLVESSYGYHIILRKDVAEGLALYPGEKEQFAQEHLLSLVDLELAQSEVVYDAALTDYDYGAFYNAYSALVAQIRGTDTENAESDTETGDETTPDETGTETE